MINKSQTSKTDLKFVEPIPPRKPKGPPGKPYDENCEEPDAESDDHSAYNAQAQSQQASARSKTS